MKHPGANGIQSMKRAACIIRDAVTKRMKVTEERYVHFVYHNTSQCYKDYTHSQKLSRLEKEALAKEDADPTNHCAENTTGYSNPC